MEASSEESVNYVFLTVTVRREAAFVVLFAVAGLSLEDHHRKVRLL